jgi:hypothetical protein
MSQFISEHYRYNISRMTIFLKIIRLQVRINVYGHIWTIIVLMGGKLTEFYFSYLFSIIYYSVTTHIRPSKKIRYLSSSDVNSRPVS